MTKTPDIRTTPSFTGLKSSSPNATRAKRATRANLTSIEQILDQQLAETNYAYERSPSDVVGRPDFVLRHQRIAIFCDGDFWHGRNWEQRKAKLISGSNSEYWIAKIESNITRDAQVTTTLLEAGWRVLRFWETDIRAGVDLIHQITQNAD